MSKTLSAIFRNLLLDGIVEERRTELTVDGVVLDTKLLFENQLRLMAASVSSKLGL